MSSYLTLIGRIVTGFGPPRLSLAHGRLMGVSVRNMSEMGSGEGKGGGGGGSIRKSGGPLGKRSHTKEEQFFRDKQSKELKELQFTINTLRAAKIEYHNKQMQRHLDQIKEHEDMMAKDKDVSHKIYIKSHKEAVKAHQQYLEKVKKCIDVDF